MGLNIKPTDHMIQTLKLIQNAGHTTAIIAGGAIRDTYHDTLVSDIDIYIQHPSCIMSDEVKADCTPIQPFQHHEWYDYWSKITKLRSPQARSFNNDQVRWSYSQYEAPNDTNRNNEILAVWDIFKGFNMYQIIFTSVNPIDYVNRRFDFGLCKAYCDGSRVHFTSDFMSDSMNKTITLVGEDLSDQQVQYALSDHLPKIHEKYPGYRLIVPDEYSHVAKTQ